MARGAVSVLVVDDEPSLRLLCRVNLELDGFAVLEAGTVGEARKTLDSKPIEVVILDVHVGTGDGRQLLAELRAEASSTRVLMLTGTADIATSNLDAADKVMAKPFDPAELVSTVRELAGLDRPESGNGDSTI
jgi:DNA-binding response OmpR family regulator